MVFCENFFALRFDGLEKCCSIDGRKLCGCLLYTLLKALADFLSHR